MRRNRRVVLLVAVSVAIFVAVPIAVGALLGWELPETRGFSIDRIAVEAEVLADGSMLVTEEVTYTFTGADDDPFSVGSRSFEPGRHPGRATDIVAYEGDQPLDTVASTMFLFEWDIYPAQSGTRTYRLEYRVENAVQVWSDTAELYWNWIGRSSPAIGEWSARVRLPAGSGQVRAWAHGPLDGVVNIDGDRVLSAVDNVPAGQFVDNRIIVPTDRFAVAASDTPRLEPILAEEERNARIANRERERADRTERTRQALERSANALVLPVLAAAVAAFYWVWRRWGKDPDRPNDIGDYWREVPDDPPAVGAALLKWGTVDNDGFSATVLDLARRGYLRIEEASERRGLRRDRVDHRFVATSPDSPDRLNPSEQQVLHWMFGEGASVTQATLVSRAKKDPTKANAFWTKFRSTVKEDLDSRRYIAKGKGWAFAWHFLIVTLVFVFAVFAFIVGAIWAGGLALVTSTVLAPLGVLHRSRTVEGTRRHAKWEGLQRFLKDFSMLDEAPVGHLALWDHYLVAAVALGVAEELLEALETKFPEVLESGSVASWYLPHATSAAGIRGIGNFGTSFGATTVTAFSPPSSSSGGGGGFSSGGGGGGGGGGFGAR